jgi:hypothetical protein
MCLLDLGWRDLGPDGEGLATLGAGCQGLICDWAVPTIRGDVAGRCQISRKTVRIEE